MPICEFCLFISIKLCAAYCKRWVSHICYVVSITIDLISLPNDVPAVHCLLYIDYCTLPNFIAYCTLTNYVPAYKMQESMVSQNNESTMEYACERVLMEHHEMNK